MLGIDEAPEIIPSCRKKTQTLSINMQRQGSSLVTFYCTFY